MLLIHFMCSFSKWSPDADSDQPVSVLLRQTLLTPVSAAPLTLTHFQYFAMFWVKNVNARWCHEVPSPANTMFYWRLTPLRFQTLPISSNWLYSVLYHLHFPFQCLISILCLLTIYYLLSDYRLELLLLSPDVWVRPWVPCKVKNRSTVLVSL